MTARVAVQSVTGAILYISSGIPVTYDQAGYEATDQIPTWTAVGQVENYGNHGVTAAVSKFTPVDTAVTAKIKGGKDYGQMALVIGHLPGDAGQVILRAAAEAANSHYSIKLLYQDGEIHYLDVLVTKFENQDGAAGDVQRVSCSLEICKQPVIVLP